MNLVYSFRHMSSSEALKFDFERKFSGPFSHFIQNSRPVYVTFSVEGVEHKVHVSLHAKSHAPIEAEGLSDDMHKSIDLVIDTLHRSLSRNKEKLVAHHQKTDRFEELEFKADESFENDGEDEGFAPHV